MTTTWLNDIASELGYVAGTGSYATASWTDGVNNVEFIAGVYSDFYNSLVLTADGTNSINELITGWNLNNPQYPIIIFSGDGTLIPSENDTITFKGNINPEYNDVFNTKEDAEVLKGLFIGRRTHQQHADIHTIKMLKMWDIL